jgi:HAD superfamily hydrolase (TIGR01509 family)
MAAQWGVVFDLDGLLVDSEPLQARSFNVVLEPYGIHLTEEDFEELVGFETIDNFRVLRRRHAIDTPLETLMERKNAAYHHLVRTELQTRTGVRELIAALQEDGAALAVASSSPRADVLLSLDAVGIRDAFSVVVTANDVERTKPAPDLYLLACNRLGLEPAACVAFEDSGAGLTAAVAAGLTCFAVPHRYTRDHDFSRAAGILDDLAQVTPSQLRTLVAR